jgi:hypothetical protein
MKFVILIIMEIDDFLILKGFGVVFVEILTVHI